MPISFTIGTVFGQSKKTKVLCIKLRSRLTCVPLNLFSVFLKGHMLLNKKEGSKQVVDREVILVKTRKPILTSAKILTRIVKIPTISTSANTRRENL